VDFNVPLEGSRIVDDTRIREALPTIQYLIEQGARVVLMTHVGRPDGAVDEAYRTTPLAARLAELLGRPVLHLDESVGPAVEAAVKQMRPGDVVMLENVRFHRGETGNDPAFAKELASLGDAFVNDAFGTAHRAHASTVGVAAYLPAVAGLLMEREVATLGRILSDPPRPLVAILGGSKISTKIGVIRNLLPRIDHLCIGGAMACTFFKADGLEVGRSLVEDDQLETARELVALAASTGHQLHLPLDAVVATEAKFGVANRAVDVGAIPPDLRVLDIGPMTVERFLMICDSAGAVVWNGPLGVYEVPPFDQGTASLARGLAGTAALTVVGGGDLVAALKELGLAGHMSFVSTGGGASLEFLEGKTLPGLAALREKTP
jgi:phosphoglycerate kinase